MRTRKTTDTIGIHHSLSGDVSSGTIKAWHMDKGWEDIGYHFVIRKNGRIEKGRAPHLEGAHIKGNNRTSIGICLAGNFHIEKPTDAQYRSLNKLLDSLCVVYSISRIIPHRDEGNITDCPNRYFDWSLINSYRSL